MLLLRTTVALATILRHIFRYAFMLLASVMALAFLQSIFDLR
jgi:hypothetical protein